MKNNNVTINQVEFLDLNHPYLILVPKDDDAQDLLFDGKIYVRNGEINDKFEYMEFNEKQYLLLEKYLFNFICAECGLIITMYEEEWIEGDMLYAVEKITDRMIVNSDNEEFIGLANKFLDLVKLAIKLDKSLVLYF